MRRKLILLGLFAGLVLSAGATERITVDQLEQRLAPAATHLSPAELFQRLDTDTVQVPQFDGLELSERLTSGRLARLVVKYKLGAETVGALELLADRSAFLDPPVAELPNLPAPDRETQQRMQASARSYVFQTLSRLPNFFATRTTSRFDDAPRELNARGVPLRTELHLVGTSSLEITFRDGKEVMNPIQAGPALRQSLPEVGLGSSGEFGPEAAIVLMDTAKGTFAFSHWEQTPAGLSAVYRYTVPWFGSHYEVSYGCLANSPFHATPGYYGSVSIDPLSGAILRITLQTEWKATDPISHVASVIEYGPVVIGERSFICPVRSLTLMMEEANACARKVKNQKLDQPVTLMNRTSFSHYHRLGSTARILPADEKADEPGAAAPETATPGAPVPSPSKPEAGSPNKVH